jgi:hypothetical protein
METLILYSLLALAILAVIVGLRKVVLLIGYNCQECGERMIPFHRLPTEDQADILEYFKEYENREPDKGSIFVCRHCLYVYDDFISEKSSLKGDKDFLCKVCNRPSVGYLGECVHTGDIEKFKKANSELIEGIECLRCARKPTNSWDCVGCDTKLKVTGCRNCYVLYSWMSVYGSKYKFYVPLKDKTVLGHPRKGFL